MTDEAAFAWIWVVIGGGAVATVFWCVVLASIYWRDALEGDESELAAVVRRGHGK